MTDNCRVPLEKAIHAVATLRRGIDEPFITGEGATEGCHGNVYGVGSTVVGEQACEKRGLVRTSDNMQNVTSALQTYFWGKRKN